GGFQLVPVKLLLLGTLVLVPIGLDQHHRQVGDLGEVPSPGCERGLARVETFIVTPAAQLPEEFDQRGLTGAGLADDLEEWEALLVGPDLLCEQRAQPKG